MRINLTKLRIVALLAVWQSIVLYVYKTQIHVFEFYMGFSDRPYGAGLFLLHLGISALPILWLPTRLDRPSAYALWYLYIATVASVAQVSYLMNDGGVLDALFYPTLMVGGLGVMSVFARQRLGLPKLIVSPVVLKVLIYAVSTLSVASIGMTLYYFGDGVSFNLYDSVAIYGKRESAQLVADQTPIIGYVLALSSGLAMPFFLALFFRWRAWWMLVVAFAAALATFVFDATKASLLTPVLMLVLGLVAVRGNRLRRPPSAAVLIIGACLVGIASIVVFRVTGQYEFTAVSLRRAFVVPVQAFKLHIDFFSTHPLMMFTDSVLNGVLGARYDLPVPMLLGREYFSLPDMSVNAGIVPSAFAHFGVVGVLVVCVLAGLTFSVLDGFKRKGAAIDLFSTIICIRIAFVWSAQAMHTSLLSSGIAPLLLFYLLYQNWTPRPGTSRSLRALFRPRVLSRTDRGARAGGHAIG